MDKFIQTAINLQDASNTKEEAKRKLSISCNICSSRGIKLDCDRCPVKAHHDLLIAVFDDLHEYDIKKKADQQQLQ